MQAIARKFWAWEGPTWLVAVAIYGAWFLLIWFHGAIPWWLQLPIGAYLIAWHFSLQHEAIHSFRSAPAWLRMIVVYPPLGLWFPFPRGDLSHLPHWALHVVAVGALFWFISDVCGMPWWHYVLVIAYPGFSLGLLRAFIEHRAGRRPGERTAIVESNWLFGLLFLWNNLHVAHHLRPTVRWYELPRFYRDTRGKLLAHNGNYYFRGYAEIARRWLVKPVFVPIHPVH
ncbi:MAG: fatty acid desaturase [Proteobacteria bacterium]|nr:fatty acid desaturase [Pseudomonadota bacterium]